MVTGRANRTDSSPRASRGSGHQRVSASASSARESDATDDEADTTAVTGASRPPAWGVPAPGNEIATAAARTPASSGWPLPDGMVDIFVRGPADRAQAELVHA